MLITLSHPVIFDQSMNDKSHNFHDTPGQKRGGLEPVLLKKSGGRETAAGNIL
jgi:hypothetical protein